MTSDPRNDDFLRPASTINGIPLRPLSSGSYALLHRIGNPFVVPGNTQDHLSAALEYAYLHAAPLEAVLRAVYDSPEAFREAVFRFSQSIPLSQIPAIIREVELSLNAAASQSVEVLPRPGSEDKDSPPNF